MTTDWLQLKSITLHEGTGPPQRFAPEGASDEYLAARRSLMEAEKALLEQVEEVARQRRALPPGAVMADYVFHEEPGGRTSLRDLFGDHDTLLVYHLMFHPDDDAACAACSLWVDGLHGVSHHLARNAAFAVIAKAPIAKLRAWAQRRGWDGLRIVSSHETSFNADIGAEGPRGGQWPMVSVFTRHGDEIRHSYTQSADFPDGTGRGIDLLSPVWHALDLLPQGRGEWLPDNDYPGRARGA